MVIDNVVVEADETVFTKDELKECVEKTKKKFAPDTVQKIRIIRTADGGVDVNYTVHGQPFERIRRITGYLTGDLNSWNNAKRAEESERVKHGVDDYE